MIPADCVPQCGTMIGGFSCMENFRRTLNGIIPVADSSAPTVHFREVDTTQSARLSRAVDALPITTNPGLAAEGPARRALTEAVRVLGTGFRYQRGSQIFGEGDAPQYVFMVQSGGVRTRKHWPDGRRQVGAFHLPGDIFNLEADGTNIFGADALTISVIYAVKRAALKNLARHDADVATEVSAALAVALRRAQEHSLLLGRSAAEERLVNFLQMMVDRYGRGRSIELPMSRRDIADHLGIALETASRIFTEAPNSRFNCGLRPQDRFESRPLDRQPVLRAMDEEPAFHWAGPKRETSGTAGRHRRPQEGGDGRF